jgi:hypothetical protein
MEATLYRLSGHLTSFAQQSCSSFSIGTNRMFGRRTAALIASASAASFLLVLT